MRYKTDITPLSYQEIAAYLHLTKDSLYDWEIQALKMLDVTYNAVLLEHQNSKGIVL